MQNTPSKTEITDILKRSAIFKGVETDKIRERFLPVMKLKSFEKQTVDREFLTASYFYIIIQGSVHGFRAEKKRERRVTMFVLREGDGFDVITLLEGQENMVSYACLEKQVKCLEIPLSLMRQWAKEEPAIAKSLLIYMGRLLLELEELIFDLSLYDTGTRLIKLLLKHANTTVENTREISVLHQLTHEELASLIGSVRVVVSRQVQKLKQMSLIEVEKGKIIIKDLEALIQMIEARCGITPK